MRPARMLTAAFLVEALLLAWTTLAPAGENEDGQVVFAHRCGGCHAADLNKEGPRLRGVFGRKAAGLPGFGYSESLKKLDFRWDAPTLDRWLTDPVALAPSTDMEFRLTSATERKAVIAWLKTLR